jgi:hypothetical protein
MTNKQVAERFATTNKEGHSDNMFIYGDTIFSYGYHFPIARKTDKVDENGNKIVLFTNRDYSKTTARHKSYVWSELYQAGYRVIECDISSGRVTAEVLEYLQKQVDELHTKEKRARKEWSRESHHNQAEKITEDMATLRQAYSL